MGKSNSTKNTYCSHCGNLLYNANQCTVCGKKASKPINAMIIAAICCVLVGVMITLVILNPSNLLTISKQTESTKTTATTQKPKDVNYLYDWMVENGELIGAKDLKYTKKDANGNEINLFYDTAYSADWYIEYSVKDESGYTFCSTLILSQLKTKSKPSISTRVYGFGKFEECYREKSFDFNNKNFKKNAPLYNETCTGYTKSGDVSFGGTVLYDPTDTTSEPIIPDLAVEIDKMNSMLTNESVYQNLVTILNWLKNDFCPEADMTMADFGFDKY